MKFLSNKYIKLIYLLLINSIITNANDCKIIDNAIQLLGNDLQNIYKNQELTNCCQLDGIICEILNNENHITAMYVINIPIIH